MYHESGHVHLPDGLVCILRSKLFYRIVPNGFLERETTSCFWTQNFEAAIASVTSLWIGHQGCEMI